MWTLIRLLLEEQSDLGPDCLQKSQADDKADNNCCDLRVKKDIHSLLEEQEFFQSTVRVVLKPATFSTSVMIMCEVLGYYCASLIEVIKF